MSEQLQLGFLQDQLGYRIRLVQIAAFKDFEAKTKDYGQAPRYFGLLSLIEANPGQPQGRLAESIHLVRSSIVPIIDRLEQDGLVERRSGGRDRRLKAVWLTARGKRIMAQLRPLVLAHEERLTRGFSAREKASLLALLVKVDLNLQKAEVAARAA